ncbi:6-hydroxymethylpterin diphosphokinase MptE-like protein [Shewanella sp. Isolate8]|uniref:6-hydroxymethylpterin diphosphokinase MptE-like protein n=1 Tax=Shewanella sp. Isolate8 TaxID=2908529 RepID=UPI001EFE1DB6|nr:6-hydroxymethylpterin diphosphokinase MptE-like protein [Shewanella sp. Isolate8]MCG9745816.1 DUF115 domain-containing protein [Shewanella sp. Isolate8]
MQNNQSEITNTFAVSQFGEYYLPSVNRNTFEKIDSTTLFDNKLKKALSTPDTLHIIAGLDSGLLANYVMEQTTPTGSKYIFVELDEILSLLSIEIPSTLSDAIQVVSLEQFSTLIQSYENNLFIVKQQFKLHRSVAADGNYLDSYSWLHAQIDNAVRQAYFENSIGFTQKIFVKTQLKNVAETLRPASILRDQFRGKSCIILGGGPSLDNHAQWIKANSDNLVIIAASRVIGKLNRLAIKPDIVVSVDPQSVSFDVNKDMMSLPHDTLLICSYHVTPQILGQWRGACLYTGPRYPWNDFAKDKNIQSIGPTVINSAMEIAREMGFSQILLSGVDFCHSQTGASHTSGTYAASLGPNLGAVMEWVETYSGEMAETPMQLLQAIGATEDLIASHPQQANYINLSADAAKVKGIEHHPTDTIALTQIDAVQRHLLAPEAYLASDAEWVAHFTRTLKELTTARQALIQLNSKNNDALAIIGKLEKERTNERIAQLANKLESIEQSINKEHKVLASLIKFYGYYEFSHFLSTQQSDDWSQEEINKRTRIYYSAFKEMSEQLLEQVQSAIERTESRLAEYQEKVEVEPLCQRWAQDKQWGRALLWQERHPQQYQKLSAAEQEMLTECQKTFDALFVIKEYIDHSAERTAPIMDNAFKKLQLLRQQKHLLGITKMVQYTAPHIDEDPEIARLYNLALSYRYLLENQLQASLDAVLQTPLADRQEEELKQIIQLSLQLNNLPLALEHYAKIVKYSDEYLPQYAHALNLNGDPQAALGIYLDYLDKYPQDIPVMLKLGIFLAQAGQIDGAASCFENVLMLDEHNQAALNYLKQIKP